MVLIDGGDFQGERSLYGIQDAIIESTRFHDGESPLKECRNLILSKVDFQWKYPLWYGKDIRVSHSHFALMSRSGIWYTQNISVSDTVIEAPKEFRHSQGIALRNVSFLNGDQTLWSCQNVQMAAVKATGDYFLKDSRNVTIDGLELAGNYLLDGGRNIHIANSVLKSKDAFWNSQDVLVENSTIDGEYIGWNSQNLRFVNCHIRSHQGFCYVKDLTLVHCTLSDSDLVFERSTVNAQIDGTILSVKNPYGGRIESQGIQTLILDSRYVDPTKTVFVSRPKEA